MNFIKRRFSSSDLIQDVESEDRHGQIPRSSGPPPVARPDATGFSLTGLTNKMSSTISAPTSPAKAQTFGQPSMTSMYSQVQGITKNLFQAATGQKGPTQEHSRTLLVIDDQHTDWSKYFRGKKILGDWDIRVEQAEFSELSLASFSDGGCVVDMQLNRGGTRVNRSFKPDFVLIRQYVRDTDKEWRNFIIGLLYGGVPSVNSLHSVYNFCDKPWVFAHLLMIQRRLGKEKFPLIDQAYYPDHRLMTSAASYPVVVKIGHAHRGLGKIKVNTAEEFHDVVSLVALSSRNYCTAEQFFESKYDIHVQKIGTNYKAFMRKSISGNWKSNLGSAMLEQIAMTDKYKSWVDEVAQLFGGLDICAVKCIVGKDGQECVFEVSDCAFTLLGETQEEDRRQIADLLLMKMNHILGVRQALSRKESMGAMAPQNFIKHESPFNQPQPQQQQQQMPQQPVPQQFNPQSMGNLARSPAPQGQIAGQPGYGGQPMANQQPRPTGPPPQGQPGQFGPPGGPRPPGTQPPSMSPSRPQGPTPPGAPPYAQPVRMPTGPPPRAPPPRPTRAPSVTSQSSQDDNAKLPQNQQNPQQPQQPHNPDDTMTNLKKTFAGIFGDM